MKIYKRFFWPDTHFPFHDPKAVEIALQIAKAEKPDEIIFLGDLQDCYSVSSFVQDPEKAFALLDEEMEQGKAFMKRIEREVRPSKIVYIEGNHENRIERYINGYAPRLKKLINPRDILGVPKHWSWVPWGQNNIYRAGKLIATHGTICGKHVCSQMLDKYGSSVIFGHTHRIQKFQKRNVNGQVLQAHTIGWLGDAKRAMEYIENVTDSAQAVAVQYTTMGQEFVQVYEIEKHVAVHNGKVIRA